TKCEWDFRDRKFSRWAKQHLGEVFDAEIVEAGESAKAVLLGDIKGITVNLHGDNVMLFDKIRVKISEVNIAQAVIMTEMMEKLSKEEMEL
ncbi:MAG TPA: ribonuclease, partial [Sulfurovum sp.]|nr:ribonuclease [Sulfurovum sp.]